MAYCECIFQALRKTVKHKRAMRIDHSFRFARRTGCETHRRRFILLKHRIFKFIVGRTEQVFIAFILSRNRLPAERHDKHALKMHLRANRFVDGKEDVVNDQIAIARVVSDVSKLVGMQPKIQRMEHATGSRYAEVCFEMRRMIPHQRGDAVASSKSGQFQSASQASSASIDRAIIRASDRAVGPARNDFHLSVKLSGTLENRHEREWKVHHCSEHGNLRSAWAHRTTDAEARSVQTSSNWTKRPASGSLRPAIGLTPFPDDGVVDCGG